MAAERGEIEAAYGELRRMTDLGDWKGWADLWAEDATLMNPMLEEPVRGRENLRSLAESWPVIENHVEWLVIDGNRLVVGLNERPRGRPDTEAYRFFATFLFNDDGLIASYECMLDPAAVAAGTAS